MGIFLRITFLGVLVSVFSSLYCCSFAGDEEKTTGKRHKTESFMPFKLGFEFQEIGGLCPWALHNQSVQKKPLFSMLEAGGPEMTNSQTLWHVVIDTDDIEFVTPPFSHSEASNLGRSIETLVEAFGILKSLLDNKKVVTFKEWTSALGKVDLTEVYRLVQDKPIQRPHDTWTPRFAPQITIQHHLEWTIPLYFSLVGFSTPSMIPFKASIPLLDTFQKALKDNDSKKIEEMMAGYCTQKLNGLVFLHALTLVSMTPIEECEDSVFLHETVEHLEKYKQVDPKINLSLMSRRPFSSMLKDIQDMCSPQSYVEYFHEMMQGNEDFNEIFEVPNLFEKTNYAEQFFDLETEKVRSMLHFKDFFDGDFLKENDNDVGRLLEQGVLSTSMVRNFKKEVRTLGMGKNEPIVLLQNYYTMAIETVLKPTLTYVVHPDKKEEAKNPIEVVRCSYDVLSPPLLLDSENSMGNFKDDRTMEYKLDKAYGEAIIEVRNIGSVQKYFLNKCGLDEKEVLGKFLQKPESLLDQAIKLFQFLKDFAQERIQKDIRVYGIPAALR